MNTDITRELFFSEHRHLDTPANDNSGRMREIIWGLAVITLLSVAAGAILWAVSHGANAVFEWMGV
jgi:hypothetical protein